MNFKASDARRAATTASELAGAAAALWEMGSLLGKTAAAESGKEWYYGRLEVVMFGCTGTGKSSLIDSLAAGGAAVDEIDLESRTLDKITRIVTLEGSRFRVTDTPGELDARQKVDRTFGLIQERGRGKFNGKFNKIARIGIINVVSYGYHEYSKEAHQRFESSSGTLNLEELEQHKTKEISELSGCAQEIAKIGVAVDWVMTAVNKADLWQDQRDSVKKHYTSGDYQKTIDAHFGGASILVAPYCSYPKEFYNQLSMSGRFGESDRRRVNAHFLDQFVKTGVGRPVR